MTKFSLPSLPNIDRDAHKKTRGHALIIAGSKEKSGAAVLASLASMRAGVGLSTLALPSAAHTIIKSQLINVMSEEFPSSEKSVFDSSAMSLIPEFVKDKTAVLMGPGLAPDSTRVKWIEKILQNTTAPFILDAQALSDVGQNMGKIDWSKHPAVITPHEGEMSKLTGLSVEEIHKNRTELAITHAKHWKVHIILKGFQTVIATPSGETWINMVDHPCLSVAGTGDVLSGILTSLLAQGVPMFDACKLSVYIHGRAGQRLGERIGVRGVLASDLVAEIPTVIHELDQN